MYIYMHISIYIHWHFVFLAFICKKKKKKKKRAEGSVVLTDLINKTYSWHKITKTSVISFWEVPSLQYEWHPGLLPAWIIAFFLPVNVPAISIGCSISSTLLCQITLCYCCVSWNGCHVPIQGWLPLCSQAVPEALTSQGREIQLSWKFLFQSYLETMAMLTCSKKYWHKGSVRHISRAGLDGTSLISQMGRGTLLTCDRQWAGLSTAGLSFRHLPAGVEKWRQLWEGLF